MFEQLKIIKKVFAGKGFLSDHWVGDNPRYTPKHISLVNPLKLQKRVSAKNYYYDAYKLSLLKDAEININSSEEIVFNEQLCCVHKKQKDLKKFLNDCDFYKYFHYIEYQ